MSHAMDSSHGVILGKAKVRKLILGKHPFNIAQGDKKESRIVIVSADGPKYCHELYLNREIYIYTF